MEEIKTQLYKKLFHHTNDLVIVIDNKGKVVDYNETAHVFLPDIKIGSDISNQFDRNLIDELPKEESPVVRKSIIRESGKKKNSKRVYLLSALSLSRKKVPIYYLLILKDITESEKTKKKIEKLRLRVEKLNHSVKLLKIGKSDNTTSHSDALEKLEKANKKLAKLNNAIIRELELAATLQKSLLPRSFNINKKLKITAHFEPIGHVGGDFFDIVNLNDERVGIFIADVSGHGVSSAFIAAMLKISFNNWSLRFSDPSNLLKKLNEEYCSVIMTGDYVTAFYLIFDIPEKRVVYSGAGHPPVLLYVERDDTVKTLSSEGFFIGMFEGSKYTSNNETFEKGNKCIVYTDGLIEAYSKKYDKQFGIERLREVFFKNKKEPVSEVVRNIISEVKSFVGKGNLTDDIAIVGVESI